MHEIKRMLKRHMEENLFKYILVLSIFAVGIALGFILSANLDSKVLEDINKETEMFISEFSNGIFSRGEIIKISLIPASIKVESG